MTRYDLDAFLDGQEPISITFKGRTHTLDPDIPFPDLLRAFTLMQDFSKVSQQTAEGEEIAEEDMEGMNETFSKMQDMMRVIIGDRVWAELEADGIGFRALQYLLPKLMTDVTNTLSGEDTPETPEEEEERALAQAGEDADSGKAVLEPVPQTSSVSFPPSEQTSPPSTVSGETR